MSACVNRPAPAKVPVWRSNREQAMDLAWTLYQVWPGATGDSVNQWAYDAEGLGLILHTEAILLNAFHIDISAMLWTLREN